MFPRFVCRPLSEAPTGPGRVVDFLRHGEAAHQVANAQAAARGGKCRCPELDPADPARRLCPYRDPALIDSPLTAKGRDEARGVAVSTGATLVLAAPMTRCLETARLAFDPLPPAARPPVLALEELRPRISAHRHSMRAPREELARRFPEVDLAAVPPGPDTAWTEADEPRSRLDARTARFLALMASRPEARIAVVAHFTTLYALFGPAGDTRMLGANPERPPDDPAMLTLEGDPREHPVTRFLAPGEVRSFRVWPR